MHLCSHRPEGFGPHSNLHPGLPTTCFIDVIVVPLPTWIYLASLTVLIPYLYISHRRSHQELQYDATKVGATDINGGKSGQVPPKRSRRIWTILLRILYFFFIIAIIAMLSLEIARLVDAELGIGLLPFTYAGVVLAAFLHYMVLSRSDDRTTRSAQRLMRLVNAAFWILLLITLIIKIVTYCKEGVHSRDNRAPVDNYKVTDEVTDLGVMVFLVVVLAGLEIVSS